MRSLFVLALALSASSLVGCGTTLRGRVEACAARPSLGCSSAFARLAAEDRGAAVDAYRRMAARMVATCDQLKATALASGEPEGASQRELTNDAFVCLRVAALQLGAAGVEAGRIAMQESSLAPDAIRSRSKTCGSRRSAERAGSASRRPRFLKRATTRRRGCAPSGCGASAEALSQWASLG